MGEAPRRIQRSRAKGWRMPPNAIYVGRPTPWGNRVRVIGPDVLGQWFTLWPCGTTRLGPSRQDAANEAVKEYQLMLWCHGSLYEQAKMALRGHDLCCWCPLDTPCHADVLLEIANA